MMRLFIVLIILGSVACKSASQQSAAASSDSQHPKNPPTGYITKESGTLASLDVKIYGKNSITLPDGHKVQILRKGESNSLVGFEIGDEYFEGNVNNTDFLVASRAPDSADPGNLTIEPYQGPLTKLSAACFMDDRVYDAYKSCLENGCSTIKLENGGMLTGSVGCDTSIDGKWRIRNEKIEARFTRVTACNHYVPANLGDDKKKIEAFCNDFHKRTKKTGTFTISPIGDGRYTIDFNERGAPKYDGKLYIPKLVRP